MSKHTLTKLFQNEPGVLRLEFPTGKRKYIALSIPESVAGPGPAAPKPAPTACRHTLPPTGSVLPLKTIILC